MIAFIGGAAILLGILMDIGDDLFDYFFDS
jgi:hypothetical protein